ncbi:MAG: dienelactone hydrolase family protein [Pseudolysinimonas sp.]
MTAPLFLDETATVWSVPGEQRHDLPLVIVMHGRGSDENDLAALFGELPAGFVYASVRAPFDEGPGWSWFEAADGNESGDPAPENADRAADAVLEWLDGLGWAPPLVGTLGFSQGGAMSTHVLRRDPGRVRFAVNLAGFIARGGQPTDDALAVAKPPVFWGRGAEDALFSAPILTRSEPWLASHSTLESHVYPGLGHSISREELDDVVAFLRAREGRRQAL